MDDFQFLAFSLEKIPYVVAVLAIAFTVHEFAHAYVAYKFGDPTAKKQGRLTLSPLAHLDPIGTILIFIAGFGWARPVPVNRSYFKKPRLAGVLVSVAGPISNLLIAFIGLAIWYAMLRFGVVEGLSSQVGDIFYNFIEMLVWLNVLLFLFNLLPFPPLDGYRIIEDLVPADVRAKMTKFESYGVLIFLLFVFTPLDKYTIQPVFQYGIPSVIGFLDSILAPILL